jgi:hypothetical protein
VAGEDHAAGRPPADADTIVPALTEGAEVSTNVGAVAADRSYRRSARQERKAQPSRSLEMRLP